MSCFIKGKTAFTLAEVLLAVAIIGLVAALTIPNFMHNYRKKVYSVRLKSFYNEYGVCYF